MNLVRAIKHLFVPQWLVGRAFPKSALAAVEQAIAASEKQHTGELRFVVEGGLPLDYLWHDTPRRRAEDLFAELRVWDTDHNCGILLYVQWVDHAVEILADRGIAARVSQAEWDAICRSMEAAFKRKEYQSGALAAIERASGLLATHFPSSDGGPNELSDRPLII